MQRLLDFAQRYQITIRLAYYPPYHSKYNPVERCWGILEQHWNGSLLDTVDTVIQYARTMTWKGKSPVVTLVATIYQTGVKLTMVFSTYHSFFYSVDACSDKKQKGKNHKKERIHNVCYCLGKYGSFSIIDKMGVIS